MTWGIGLLVIALAAAGAMGTVLLVSAWRSARRLDQQQLEQRHSHRRRPAEHTQADWGHRYEFGSMTLGSLTEKQVWEDRCRDGWPDEEPLPGLPAPDPLAAPAAGVDLVLASEAEDPANAGWTDQLLADLHNAPTSLDQPGEPARIEYRYEDRDLFMPPADERMANTGEIAIVGQRADWAAELRDQDDDAAEFISRMASRAAEVRIEVSKTA